MSIPVGMVVAPVPVDLLRAGPVFVTTLYAIPAGPVPAPSLVRFVPWPSYPPNPAPQPYSAQYSAPAPQYPAPPAQYTAAQSPPTQYSQPAPPSPTYYQHSGGTDGGYVEESSDREPPSKLYTQFAAGSFQNSKESPLLHQLREESEKNRNKYAPPSYSNQYQTVDAP
uniref:Uncharacterized protein n=1 Tax=Schizaphis graminum TaxID=13262 RepID=A0A2S2N7C1_SCHGA